MIQYQPSLPAQVDRANGMDLLQQIRAGRSRTTAMLPANYFGSTGGLALGRDGLTPAQRRTAERLGQPYTGIGKTNIGGLMPGARPLVPQGGALDFTKPPQVNDAGAYRGMFENLLSGLVGVAALPLPGFVRDPAMQIAGSIGQVADIVPNTVANAGFLSPWAPSVEEAFGKLPDSADKRRIEQIALQDPDLAAQWMAQYINTHEQEFGEAYSLNRAFTGLFMPGRNLLERFLGTALDVGGAAVRRTYAGSGFRNLDQTVLNLSDEELSRMGLLDAVQKYRRGQLSRDELIDEVSVGFAFSNDPVANLVFSILTDPLTIGTFGVGKVAQLAGKGASFLRAANALKGLQAADPVAHASIFERTLAQGGARIAKLKPSLTPEQALEEFRSIDGGRQVAREAFEDMLANHPEGQRFADEALGLMTRTQRAQVAIDPFLQGVAHTARYLTDPFRFFGAGVSAATGKNRGAEVVGTFQSDAVARGRARAFGIRNYRRIMGAAQATDTIDELQTIESIAAANQETAIHQSTMARSVTESGLPVEATTMTPLEMGIAAGARRRDALEHQAETFTRRNAPELIPDQAIGTLQGKARDDALHGWRLTLEARGAQMLAFASGMTIEAARAAVRGGNDGMLQWLHSLNYGKTIQELHRRSRNALSRVNNELTQLQRLKAAGEEVDDARLLQLAGQSQSLARATLISGDTLTTTAARELLERIEGGASNDELRRLAGTYGMLRNAPGLRTLDNDLFRTRLEVFLRAGLVGEAQGRSAFVRILELTELPAELQELVRMSDDIMGPDRGYRIGVAPPRDKQWGTVHDVDGNIIGSYPWMDLVSDARPPTWNPSTWDMVRTAIAHPIGGARLMEQARRDFRIIAAKDYGMDENESYRLWHALREAANLVGVHPRGLDMNQFRTVMENAELDAVMRQHIGDAGLAQMTARAFAGDIASLGIGSWITGQAKVRTARWNNVVGLVADKYYPQIRFGAVNILFQAQEVLEPYFFNYIRGYKPVLRHMTEDDKLALIAFDRMGIIDWDDFDQSAIAYQALQGWYNTSTPDTFGSRGMLAHQLDRFQSDVTGIRRRKFINYVRAMRNINGQRFKESWLRGARPQTWADLEGHYGTTDPGQIAVRYFLDNAIFQPDDPFYSVHQAMASTPGNLGKQVRITTPMLNQVAKAFDFRNADDLRTEVREGRMTEGRFRDWATTHSWDDEYISRTWRTLSGPSADAFWEGFKLGRMAGGASEAEARASLNLIQMLARARAANQGISIEEFIANNFEDIPKFLDSSKDLPAAAVHQTAYDLVTDLGAARPELNMVPVRREDARFKIIQKLAQAMMPPARQDLIDEILGAGAPQPVRRTKNMTDERYAELQAEKQAAFDRDRNTNITPSRVKLRSTGQDMYFDVSDPATAEAFAKQWLPDGEMDVASRWYDETVTLATALADLLSEEELLKLADVFETAQARKLGLARTTDVVGPVSRDEMAARLLMAFLGTQQSQSPLQGLVQIASVLDEVLRGIREGGDKGYGAIRTRLDAMLREGDTRIPSKGMASKLFDFHDSGIGSFVRSVFPTSPLSPAAMDIWMFRLFGNWDQAMYNYAINRLVTDGLPSGKRMTVEAAEAILRDKVGITRDRLISDLDAMPRYEVSLAKMNRIRDHFNKVKLGGRKDWEIAQVQAVLWVAQQKQLGITGMDIGSLVRQQSMTVAFEYSPSGGVRFPSHIHTNDTEVVPPTGETIVSAFPAWEKLTPQQRRQVTNEFGRSLLPMVERLTGVRVIDRPTEAYGVWREGGIERQPNITWTLYGSDAQIADALDMLGYLAQQDEVMALRNARAYNKQTDPMFGGPTGRGVATGDRAQGDGGRYWSLDGVLDPTDAADPQVIDALQDHLMLVYPDMYGSMVARSLDGVPMLRSVWMPFEDEVKRGKPTGRSVIPSKTMEDFEAGMAAVNPRALASLTTGSWAEKRFGRKIPVTMERRVVDVRRSANRADLMAADQGAGSTWERQRGTAQQRAVSEGIDPEVTHGEELGRPFLERLIARGRGDLAGLLVSRGRHEAHRMAEQAFAGAAPDLVGRARAQRILAEQGGGAAVGATLHQRGVKGVRAALSYEDGRAATLYLLGSADRSSGVHELAHVFSRELDPSGKVAVVNGYKQTEGARLTGLDQELNDIGTQPVTWYHSDLVGSTQLEKRIGTERYTQIREDLKVLTREVINETNAAAGRAVAVEVSTAGDAFLVRFDSARTAVEVAQEVQRRMREKTWDADVGTVEMRIGLDSGKYVEKAADPAGLGINRAVRLEAAAPKGGILISGLTHSLAGNVPGAKRYTRRLKDFDQVEVSEVPTSGQRVRGGVRDGKLEVDRARRATNKRRQEVEGMDETAPFEEEVEEWFARQFEGYVAGGAELAPTAALAPIFNEFGHWAGQTLDFAGSATVNPELRMLFDSFLKLDTNQVGRATWDMNQFRIQQAAYDGAWLSEKEAHTIHYYRRGRSWAERTVNHPYLGMYPASYMWGKVLPELMRFMFYKPFGTVAPLAGLQLMKHVGFYLQLEAQTNPDFQEFLDDNPKLLRFLSMLIPGTPWEVPVNVPAYARHLTEDVLQNRLRLNNGLPEQQIDVGRVIGDSVSYAFGPQRAIEDPLAVYTDLHHWLSGEPDKDDPKPTRMSQGELAFRGLPTFEEFAATWSERQRQERAPRS